MMDPNPYAASSPGSAFAKQPVQATEGFPRSIKIKRIGVLRSSLWGGMTMLTLSILIAPLLVVVIAVAPRRDPESMAALIAPLVIVPVMYTIMGFILGLVAAVIYNACASVVGGITLDLE